MVASWSKWLEKSRRPPLIPHPAISAGAGVPREFKFLRTGIENSDDIDCSIREVPTMYAFIAESIARIPIHATNAPELSKRIPAAVATGAGESASASTPTLPMSEIFNRRYKDATIPITMMSDRRISVGSRVSSTGIALISNPVNGQYTIMIVASNPVTVSGVDGAKFLTLINGMSRSVTITRGMILSVVRIFSVIPENEMPVIFSQQKAPIMAISIRITFEMPNQVIYWPMPAAIVDTPNTDEIR